MPTPGSRAFAALVVLLALAALGLQYGLLLRLSAAADGVGYATIRFFSYFTVLSNILVVLAAGSAVAGGRVPLARFFARPRVLAGVALYIGVTGVVYVAILRHLWQPQGAQWWADTGLHYAVPLLYLGWWLSGPGHGALRWRDLPRWLVFPLLYLLWCLLRGAWMHEYPYPFIDVDAIGLSAALRNAAGVLLLFLAGGVLLIGADRLLARAGRRARG